MNTVKSCFFFSNSLSYSLLSKIDTVDDHASADWTSYKKHLVKKDIVSYYGAFECKAGTWICLFNIFVSE